MDFHTLKNRLETMPMLRILMPFVVGIALAFYGTLPLWLLAGAFVWVGVTAIMYRSEVSIVGMIFLVGFTLTQLRLQHTPTLPMEVRTTFSLKVDGIPQSRSKGMKADAEILAWRNPTTQEWHATHGRIFLHTDSLTTLHAEERLLVEGRLHPLKSKSASFIRAMQMRGYRGVMWLRERNLLSRDTTQRTTLHTRSSERIARLGIKAEEEATLQAMTTGNRSQITPSLREAYSRSGFSHLLAVSGLHMGVVFVVLNVLLWWMPLLRWGHLLRNVILIVAIWLFVAVAGFPPSAIRSAVMYTILQLSLMGGDEYSSLNALSGAAFLMLLYKPQWLCDVSFQLSFLAVGLIIAWGVPLLRQIHTPYRLLNRVIDALGISLVASLATAPLLSHTFGIMPLLGVVLNPLAILLATVIVFVGVVWLIFPIGCFADGVAWLLEGCTSLLNQLAYGISALPHTSLEHHLSTPTTALIYGGMFVFTLWLWGQPAKNKLPLSE